MTDKESIDLFKTSVFGIGCLQDNIYFDECTLNVDSWFSKVPDYFQDYARKLVELGFEIIKGHQVGERSKHIFITEIQNKIHADITKRTFDFDYCTKEFIE